MPLNDRPDLQERLRRAIAAALKPRKRQGNQAKGRRPATTSQGDVRILVLDATRWTSVGDFYDAVLAAVGAPAGHGRSIDALIDSMIWGGINAREPPYTVRIVGASSLSDGVREHIELAGTYLAKARVERREREGHDVEVRLEIE